MSSYSIDVLLLTALKFEVNNYLTFNSTDLIDEDLEIVKNYFNTRIEVLKKLTD